MNHGVREGGGLEVRSGLSETAQPELIQIRGTRSAPPRVDVVEEHIAEFVSDAGEGAQTVGQIFGTVSARMGNGVWTVEIIPAEIEPPRRSRWAARSSWSQSTTASGSV